MAITNFIPTVWTENLQTNLDRNYVAVANCNRSFEGDIKNIGSMVKICGISNVLVSHYNKNSDMSNPQQLNDTVIEFPIDRSVYFNFQIDDVDRAQAAPHLMDSAMNVAARALANEAERYIFGLHTHAEHRISLFDPKPEALINSLIEAIEMLYVAGVTDPSEIVIEVSPYVASLLLKCKIEFASNNASALENGQLGTLFGAKVFVSNRVELIDDTDFILHNCYVRSTRAIAFAEQISEVEAYRPEKRFSDAVKGLHLYGAKMIYPDQVVCLEVGKPVVIDDNEE